ncbi:DNA internalization-related competence protein ComEC/Rec2 [Marinobacter sp. SS21]|nr:DNA internalization-related competence protein ComEC/Rec2 [Marinobacter sp. SS21]MDC0662013.1 DNA internalization-related competence protein ComEC/Rec2 [Marinobacter sp. SS21]
MWLGTGFVVLLVASRISAMQTLRGALLVMAALIGGLGWAALAAGDRLERSLPVDLEGRLLKVEGYLCDIPSPGVYNSVRFSLCVERWLSLDGSVADRSRLPRKLRLAWYGEEATLMLPHRMQAQVVLKRPHGSVNPVGFRYESWLFRHNYRATGTLRQIDIVADTTCAPECQYHRMRNTLAHRLHATLMAADHHPLAEALMIGYRGWLTPDHWRVFKDTGTIHLVAISGLHLGLIAVFVGIAVRWVLRWLPRHWLSPHRQRLVLVGVVLLVSLAFALLAGFTVPTRRALAMVAVASWLALRARQVSAWSGWLLALTLVLVFDPFAPMDQGFWLSFLAVAILILAFARRLRPASWLGALVIAQFAVFAGLWPVLAWSGQATSPVSGLANLVAIPWLSLVVMPVLLVGGCVLAIAPGLSGWVGGLFDLVLGLLWHWLAGLSALPVSDLGGGAVLAALVALAVLLCLVLPDRRVRLATATAVLVWFVVGVTLESSQPLANEYVSQPEIWFWDVGQGTSVLLRHERSVLLYDTGPESPSGHSAVAGVILPNLQRLGVKTLDHLVISHGDSDHAGGLPMLFTALPVDRVVSGEPERVSSLWRDGRSPPVLPCESGQVFMVGQLEVRLWQYQPPDGRPPAGNDASCVLAARYAGTEVILPGDISRDVEHSYLVEHALYRALDPPQRGQRLVLAPHHGSKTSSGPRWVAQLLPDLVVFSAGYRHRFGHPHDQVVDRYRAAGSKSYNTAYSGALRVVISGLEVVVEESRSAAPFWVDSTDVVSGHGR